MSPRATARRTAAAASALMGAVGVGLALRARRRRRREIERHARLASLGVQNRLWRAAQDGDEAAADRLAARLAADLDTGWLER